MSTRFCFIASMTPAESVAYLSAYLVAAVASMALFGLVLGALALRLGRTGMRGLVVAASLFTVGIGGWWLATTFPGSG